MRMIQPCNAAEWEQVRELFREYWISFGFSPCFQNFESEVAGLPGAYAPPVERSSWQCLKAKRPVLRPAEIPRTAR